MKNGCIVIAISVILITLMLGIKFRPAYEVYLNGELVGYIGNKNNFQSIVDNQILTSDEENVAFVALDDVGYSFKFVSASLINEEDVTNKLKDNSKNVYRVYEVADYNNQENVVYVNTLQEAEEMVNNWKENYGEIEPDLQITTLYLNEAANEESIQTAKAKIEETLQSELEEKQEMDRKTVNGIYLACLPVSGTITSRFGSRESIRNHTHAGLDISASYGSKIKAAADGTVTYAGWNDGGYGNLVIIDHGNGVKTYYGHCSSINTKIGATVKAGDVIAAVGSTGNSTGNHLHFEIRINDVKVDPQKYIYN